MRAVQPSRSSRSMPGDATLVRSIPTAMPIAVILSEANGAGNPRAATPARNIGAGWYEISNICVAWPQSPAFELPGPDVCMFGQRGERVRPAVGSGRTGARVARRGMLILLAAVAAASCARVDDVRLLAVEARPAVWVTLRGG